MFIEIILWILLGPKLGIKNVVKIKIKTVSLTFFKKIGNNKFLKNIAQFYSNMMYIDF